MSERYRYYTVKEAVRAAFTVKGSRFIGTLAPVSDEERARRFIESLKDQYAGATHNTYAYRTGAGGALVERAGDDREPAGTAGLPMLQALQGAGVSDAVVAGTRYFGGVKLGIGGLTRAYRQCARECLARAVLMPKEQMACYRLKVTYSELGAVNRHIESLGGEIIDVDYTGEATLTVALPARLSEELIRGFVELSRGRGRWQKNSSQ